MRHELWISMSVVGVVDQTPRCIRCAFFHELPTRFEENNRTPMEALEALDTAGGPPAVNGFSPTNV